MALCVSSRHTVDPPPVATPTAAAADSSDDENSESSKKKSLKSEKNSVLEIPESLRFDPKSMENKPKGLVDSLTKYFTPGMFDYTAFTLFYL